MNPIPLFKTSQPDPESPGQLASELADARRQYEAVRQDVIQRGTTRMQEIAALQAELDAENQALGEVVGEAAIEATQK